MGRWYVLFSVGLLWLGIVQQNARGAISRVSSTMASGGSTYTGVVYHGVSTLGEVCSSVSTNDRFSQRSGFVATLSAEQPTLVALYDFYVEETDGHMKVGWTTACEVQTAGFFLYRQEETGWVKVNATIIPSAGEGGMGAEYSCDDLDAPAGGTYIYRLVEYEVDGSTEEYGPFTRSADMERISNLSIKDGYVVLQWLGRENDQYVVYRSDNMTGAFKAVSPVIEGATSRLSFTDRVSEATCSFYRISVLEEEDDQTEE